MPLVSIGDVDLHYSFNGAPPRADGLSLVLVHGAGGSGADWPATWRADHAAESSDGALTPYPIYAVDLPGHGGSGGNGEDTVDAYARAVARFLDALALDHVLLVGHSMGAAIALSLAAARHPRVAGAALIGGSSRLAVSDAILDGLRNAFEATVDSLVKYSWHRDTDAVLKDANRQGLLDSGPDVVLRDFLACSRFDLTDRLSDVDIPALVIAADKDRMVLPDQSRAMADGLQDATFVAFEDAGHFLHVERADLVAEALAAFARQRLAKP